jgi:type III secretory pathway component EscU
MTEKQKYDAYEKKLLKGNPKLRGTRRKLRQEIQESQGTIEGKVFV